LVDLSKTISRVKKSCGYKFDKQLAEMFGLSSQDFNTRKKRGTLLPLLIEWGINQKVDLNWLFTGEGWTQGKGGQQQTLNSALLLEVIEVVELVLGKHELVLEPHDKAEAVTVLYEMYLDSGKKPEERTTERMLRLVA